jgi:hypothetical protein
MGSWGCSADIFSQWQPQFHMGSMAIQCSHAEDRRPPSDESNGTMNEPQGEQPDPMDGLRRVFELLDSNDQIASLLKRDGAAFVAYGFAMNAVVHAAAAIHLYKSDMAFAAAPSLRTLFEFAIYLRWLAVEPDEALIVLNQQLKANNKALLSLADEIKADIPAEAKAIARETLRDTTIPKPTGSLPNTMGIMKRYGLKSALGAWMGISRFAHPTLTAAECFFQETLEAVNFTNPPEHAFGVVPDACLRAVFDAALFLNVFLDGSPWTGELESVGAEFCIDAAIPERPSSSN